jgi:histidine phosphotransferase ChpT
MDSIRLASLISAKFAHEVMSIMMTVNHGIDMVETSPTAQQREEGLGLARDSAKSLWDKCLLWRFALGSQGLSKLSADIPEMKRLITTYADSVKPKVDMSQDFPELTLMEARFIVNFAIVALSHLPRGGTVTLTITDEGQERRISAVCAGDRPTIKAEVSAAFSGRDPEDGWTARNIHPYFVSVLAQQIGARPSLRVNSDNVVMLANYPNPQA